MKLIASSCERKVHEYDQIRVYLGSSLNFRAHDGRRVVGAACRWRALESRYGSGATEMGAETDEVGVFRPERDPDSATPVARSAYRTIVGSTSERENGRTAV